MQKKVSVKHNKNPDFLLELTPDGDRTSDLELDTSLYQGDSMGKTLDEHALGILTEKNKQRDIKDLNSALVSMGYGKMKGAENRVIIKQLLEDNLRLSSKVNQLTIEKQKADSEYLQSTQSTRESEVKPVNLKTSSMNFKGRMSEISEVDQVELTNAIVRLQDENTNMQSYIDELHEALEKELYRVNELDLLNRSLNKEIIKNSSMVQILKGKFIQPLYDFISGGQDVEEKENTEKKTHDFLALIESLEDSDIVKLIAKKSIMNILHFKKNNARLTESLDALQKKYTELKLDNIERTKKETLYIVRIKELKFRNKNMGDSIKVVVENMRGYKKALKAGKEQLTKTYTFIRSLQTKLTNHTAKALVAFYFLCESTLNVIKTGEFRKQILMQNVKCRLSRIKIAVHKLLNSNTIKELNHNRIYDQQQRVMRAKVNKGYEDANELGILGLKNYDESRYSSFNLLNQNNLEPEPLDNARDFLALLHSLSNNIN